MHPSKTLHDSKKIYDILGSRLDPVRSCVRILRLQPGKADDPLECTLQVVSLDDDDVELEALSYTWGDPSITALIQVNGQAFDVTINLRDFLKCLRLQDRERIIWADAICIDQSNIEEKVGQLGLTGRLYREAKEVHIWLGYLSSSWSSEVVLDAAEEDTWAVAMADEHWPGLDVYLMHCLRVSFEKSELELPCCNSPFQEIFTADESPLEQLSLILDALGDNVHLHELPFYRYDEEGIEMPMFQTQEDSNRGLIHVEHIEYNVEWLTIIRCLIWLLSRPWWGRVWTLQELLLPRADPIFHVGQWNLPVSTLMKAMIKIKEHSATCCGAFRTVWAGTSAKTLSDLIDRITRIAWMRDQVAEDQEAHVNTLTALIASSKREATDVRDFIYGVLGIVHPEASILLQHNAYRQRPREVFATATKLLMHLNKNLKPLIFAAGCRSHRLDGLPTWAIDFRHDIETLAFLCKGTEHTASSGLPYNEPRLLFDLRKPTLSVQGVHVGTVGSSSSIFMPQDYKHSHLSPELIRCFVEEWLLIHETGNEGLNDVDRFWRTVLRSPLENEDNESQTPIIDGDVSSRRFSLPDVRKWWIDYQLLEAPGKISSSAGKTERRAVDALIPFSSIFVKMLYASWRHSRFFVTAGDGSPGLGPFEIQSGDDIYVLAGCPVPIALRRRWRTSSISLGGQTKGGKISSDRKWKGKADNAKVDENNNFILKGPCYLDGLMKGEALRGNPRWVDLTLY